MKRNYYLVYLRINPENYDLRTIFSAEYGTHRIAAIQAAKDASRFEVKKVTPQGLPYDLAGVECVTETEETTYQPLYLDTYLNGVRMGRINY